MSGPLNWSFENGLTDWTADGPNEDKTYLCNDSGKEGNGAGCLAENSTLISGEFIIQGNYVIAGYGCIGWGTGTTVYLAVVDPTDNLVYG